MKLEAAQVILDKTNLDVSLIWYSNLKMWGLVMGYHMEYFDPVEFTEMDEPAFKVALHHKMMRYVSSLKGSPDYFYRN